MRYWIATLAAAATLALGSCGGSGGGAPGADASISSGGGGATVAAGSTDTGTVVASNGEGGGVGSGGTGITGGGVGYVAGFGSIYVNGTRITIDKAALTLADDTELKLGMTVKALGSLQPDFLTAAATSVESAIDARGPLSNLNAVTGTLELQGLNISIDSETVYEGVTSLAGLANGDWVKVYGQAWGNNKLRASRIEKLSAASTLILSGSVASLDTAAQTFVLGNLSIQYGSAAFSGGITASTISNGAVVRVRSTTPPAGSVLVASSVEAWYPLPTSDKTGLSVAGVVTSYAGMGSFGVLGYTVDASSAVLSGGPLTSMGDGVKVEVAGVMNGNVLKAALVKMRQIPGTGGPANFTATGAIGQFVSASSFRVQGQPIDASGATVTFTGGTVAKLADAVRVTVVGSKVVSGVLVADKVTFLP